MFRFTDTKKALYFGSINAIYDGIIFAQTAFEFKSKKVSA